jgi:hypothetical protein
MQFTEENTTRIAKHALTNQYIPIHSTHTFSDFWKDFSRFVYALSHRQCAMHGWLLALACFCGVGVKPREKNNNKKKK